MSSYTQQLRAQITDPAVVLELDRIAGVTKALDASVQALGGGQTNTGGEQQVPQNAEAGLSTGNQVNTLPVNASGQPDTAVRWLRGPWLLGADGNVPTNATIRPPALTGNVDNYAPIGIDTAIGLELTSTTNVTITGLRSAAVQRRVLFVLNGNPSGGNTITFPHANAGSIAANQFGIGASGETLILPPGRCVWFFYDAFASLWRLFALPAVPSADLPASVQPASGGLAHGRTWFAFRVASVNAGGTPIVHGIGCSNPAVDGTAVDNSTANYTYGKFTSAAQGGIRYSGSPMQAVRIDQNPIIRMRIKTPADLGNGVILWAGVNDHEDTTALSQNALVFRYDPNNPNNDTLWMACSSSVGANPGTTKNATGVGCAINTEYLLQIRVSGASAYFSVNGGAETVVNTTMPDNTTPLNAWFIRAASTLGNVVGINISQGMIEYGIANGGLY